MGGGGAAASSSATASNELTTAGEPTAAGRSRDARRSQINAPTVRFDEHLQPGQRGHYRRLVINCPFAFTTHRKENGDPCCKHRNLGQRQTSAMGQQEPEIFLRTWAADAASYTSASAHIGWNPSLRQMRRWMATTALGPDQQRMRANSGSSAASSQRQRT